MGIWSSPHFGKGTGDSNQKAEDSRNTDQEEAQRQGTAHFGFVSVRAGSLLAVAAERLHSHTPRSDKLEYIGLQRGKKQNHSHPFTSENVCVPQEEKEKKTSCGRVPPQEVGKQHRHVQKRIPVRKKPPPMTQAMINHQYRDCENEETQKDSQSVHWMENLAFRRCVQTIGGFYLHGYFILLLRVQFIHAGCVTGPNPTLKSPPLQSSTVCMCVLVFRVGPRI